MFDDEKLQHEHDLVVRAIREQLDSRTRVDDRRPSHSKAGDDTAPADPDHGDARARPPRPRTRRSASPDAGRRRRPATGPGRRFETETFDRGWYAAPISWFDGDGDGEFAVGLRSAVASGDTATLFAGNGIVADSDPDEVGEVELKFRPILDELRDR